MKSKFGPLLMTMIAGLMMVLEWFFDISIVNDAAGSLRTWAIIIEAFALGLGAVNLVILHGRSVYRKQQAWYASVFTLATMFVFAFVGIGMGPQSAPFLRLYDIIIGPAGCTMFSVLCFHIFSAGARCIRVKNLTSLLMTVAALIALVSQLPFGEQHLPAVKAVFDWLMSVVNVSAQRGIIMGAAIGAFAHSIRVLAGLERVVVGTGGGGGGL
jgi:hypothetical protein